MRLLAIWTGKVVYYMLRIAGSHGAALPGLIAEKINNKFIEFSLNKLNEGIVIITGTNGKTTTTQILSTILKSKKRVLTNPTGSNFTRGIASAVVKNSTWTGRLNFDIGVFELDEAYAAKFSQDYNPRASVVLNVMRDQMDRFGEIDYTANLISKLVAVTTDFTILNADDPRVANLANYTKARVAWFGVSDSLKKIYKNDDELHDDKIINQATGIKTDCLLLDFNSSIGKANYLVNGQKMSIKSNSSTTYNFQNIAAVILAAINLGIKPNDIIESFSNAKPAFGRGEIIMVDGINVILQLVKNPSGFRQSLISAENLHVDATMIAINDEYADGRDVSWLWDVNFNTINDNNLLTSGARAADMALRLKYEGKNVTEEIPELGKAINKLFSMLKPKQTCMIFTTYTAMLQIRKIITGKAMVD
jgi:UDP-N-acetylmuramyl tripeptide synthase